jgi:hypothetical protein
VEQLARRIMRLDSAFNWTRAERIARTETLAATHRGKWQIDKAHGCQQKRWKAMVGDPRTRDWHEQVNNQTVGIDEFYIVPNHAGEEQKLFLPCDYENGATGDNTINCRCVSQGIRFGVTDDATMSLDQFGLVDGRKAPGPVYASLEPIEVAA